MTITTPTSAATYSTSATSLNLGGTASDNVGVTQVSWSNDRGGSGVASGTTSWSVTGIALQSGANLITVTARDAAGNTGTDTLTVTSAVDYDAPDRDGAIARERGDGGQYQHERDGHLQRGARSGDGQCEHLRVAHRLERVGACGGELERIHPHRNADPQQRADGLEQLHRDLRGGTADPRIKDLAGNALAANIVWSFTTGADACPCTIWPSTEVPAVASSSDPSAVSLGVKFRSDVNGFITGIRFYKGSANTGTHVGSLWTSRGQLLATATFTTRRLGLAAGELRHAGGDHGQHRVRGLLLCAQWRAMPPTLTTLPPRASIRACCMRCRTG